MIKKEVGVWIDHRRAFIVALSEKGENIMEILSNLEKHFHISSGSFDYSEEDQLDRKFSNHLKKYYEEITENVSDADTILIFGPGKARNEFEKYLKNSNYNGKINDVEACDKMTDHQIAAKVRSYFHKTKTQNAM